jgi:hypothetical protein
MHEATVESNRLDRRLRAASAVVLVALATGLLGLGLWLEVPWH